MPKLRVEYAKSGRAKCTASGCLQAIVKHEVRLGTAVMFPAHGGAAPDDDEGQLSYKWRHLCCVTDRQLQNARAAGDIDNIEGLNDLAPVDVELVEQMKRGELMQRADIKGRVGDVANSPLAAEFLPKGKAPAKKSNKTSSSPLAMSSAAAAAAPSAPPKRRRAAKREREEEEEHGGDNASDATEEYDVVVEASKPKCPYGEKCFRTGADHIAEYAHGTAADMATPPRLRAVIKGKK